MEMSVELEFMMVVLRLPFWVQVVWAAKVRERSRLPKWDVRVVDSEDEGRSWRLMSVGSVIWEIICTEFRVGQVQFKDGGKGGYQISLLL